MPLEKYGIAGKRTAPTGVQRRTVTRPDRQHRIWRNVPLIPNRLLLRVDRLSLLLPIRGCDPSEFRICDAPTIPLRSSGADLTKKVKKDYE